MAPTSTETWSGASADAEAASPAFEGLAALDDETPLWPCWRRLRALAMARTVDCGTAAAAGTTAITRAGVRLIGTAGGGSAHDTPSSLGGRADRACGCDCCCQDMRSTRPATSAGNPAPAPAVQWRRMADAQSTSVSQGTDARRRRVSATCMRHFMMKSRQVNSQASRGSSRKWLHING
jgi:hypothetical protein